MSDRITLMLRGAAEQEARWAREAQQAAREAEQRAARAAREAADRRAADAALLEIWPRSTAQRRAFGEALARTHTVTIREVGHSIPGWGHAAWHTRTITVPADWAATEEGLAGFIHEVMHVVVGRCPGTEPHRPDPRVTDRHQCLECERLAWAEGMKRHPFSRAMFEDARRCLDGYRRATPAALAVKDAARQTASESTWARRQHDRVRREMQIAEMRAIANSPHVYTRAERDQQRRRQQLRDMETIAREALYGND